MQHFIYALFGLLVAASVEASHGESLHAFSVADSSQSFCSQCSKIADKSIEKQSAIAFSPPKIENCYQCHYSLFEHKLECAKLCSGSEIFFPSDGHQPTAADAVCWSCSNLEDELVTDWYMSMFGLSETNSQLMGFNTKNEACKIINFDPELDPTKSAEALAFKATFIANFRKIASVSVGRVLLYRLLLEIRRTDAAGNGCIDEKLGKTLKSDEIDDRNNLRKITITNSDRNSFNSSGYIRFHDSKNQKQTNVLGSEEKEHVNIIRESRTDDIGLFHEILHWFHALRDMNRMNNEGKILTTDLSNITMDDENLALWTRKNSEDQYVIKLEEFRTIMGYKIKVLKKDSGEVLYDMQEPIDGDDLSENLYRICVGQRLRYGHNTKPNQIISQTVVEHMQSEYKKALESGGYKISIH